MTRPGRQSRSLRLYARLLELYPPSFLQRHRAEMLQNFADLEDAAESMGRAGQRFQLEATARDIRTSFVNQPVEVAGVRSEFSAWLGDGMRPTLIIRFGRGKTLPYSLRQPASAVLNES